MRCIIRLLPRHHHNGDAHASMTGPPGRENRRGKRSEKTPAGRPSFRQPRSGIATHLRNRSHGRKGPHRHSRWFLYAPVRLSYQPRPSRRMYGLTSAFLLPAARKRASGVWDAQLFAEFILGQLMPDVLCYLCLILAHCVDIVTTAPELPITIFELQLTKLLIYHQAALSFQISDKRRYTHFGRYL